MISVPAKDVAHYTALGYWQEETLTDVIRRKGLSRLQTCAADSCHDVLVDLSKNRSRRFCSTSCANRTNVAAYRARQAELSG